MSSNADDDAVRSMDASCVDGDEGDDSMNSEKVSGEGEGAGDSQTSKGSMARPKKKPRKERKRDNNRRGCRVLVSTRILQLEGQFYPRGVGALCKPCFEQHRKVHLEGSRY